MRDGQKQQWHGVKARLHNAHSEGPWIRAMNRNAIIETDKSHSIPADGGNCLTVSH